MVDDYLAPRLFLNYKKLLLDSLPTFVYYLFPAQPERTRRQADQRGQFPV
ncbi:MAG TPA: hypothetical protein VIF81_03150 [Pyrinomonadaceae bacterium]|jgi:hypothetical protein